jgi:alanine racemase
VTLWGLPQKSSGSAPSGVPIDLVAQAAGTVGYELMCALAARVPVVVKD